MVGDLTRTVIGSVGHRNAGSARGFEINMVEADAGAHDDSAFGQATHHRGIDRHFVPDDDGVGGGQHRLGHGMAVDALAVDVPFHIGAGSFALDDGVVGILRIGCQNPKSGRHLSHIPAIRCAAHSLAWSRWWRR